ncbi:hypothetical protein J6590_096471 [Homalodisca vitripennis]|nr:hypothetical protein J6590_096471 [Homalodisca vitripennis]
MLHANLSDDDVGSNSSDGPPIEDSDDGNGSELFGDDTDKDPDYVPVPGVEDHELNSSSNDSDQQSQGQYIVPSTPSNRVAEQNNDKKIFHHLNGVWTLPRLHYVFDSPVQLRLNNSHKRLLVATSRSLRFVVLVVFHSVINCYAVIKNIKCVRQRQIKKNLLLEDEIRDMLHANLSDDDVGSNSSDGPPIEDSDDGNGSELFGDDTDKDPDYVPVPGVEDHELNSSSNDSDQQSQGQYIVPSTPSNRVAEQNNDKKIFHHLNGVWTLPRLHYVFDSPVQLRLNNSHKRLLVATSRSLRFVVLVVFHSVINCYAVIKNIKCVRQRQIKKNLLLEDEIRDMLHANLSDDDVGSKFSDGPPIEDSDDGNGSELFGDDTDEDPDYVPVPGVEDHELNSSSNDSDQQSQGQYIVPSTPSNRVAEQNNDKKIFHHLNGVWTLPRLHYVFDSPVQLRLNNSHKRLLVATSRSLRFVVLVVFHSVINCYAVIKNIKCVRQRQIKKEWLECVRKRISEYSVLFYQRKQRAKSRVQHIHLASERSGFESRRNKYFL